MKKHLTALLCFIVVSLVAASSFGQVADGDRFWLTRSEGHQGAKARATNIDSAIAAYQRAVSQNPNDLEARWKLIRAIRFKGQHVASGKEEKKSVYSQATKAGASALAVVDRVLAAKGVKSVSKASEKQVADAARSIPHAGSVIYWDAVAWGEWALVYGKMAAVREGVADRIKRESTMVMMMDPKIEQGGGARVLGRLHNQTPRVPFITGWASDKEAVKFLNQSLAQDPANKITQVFLAEAMYANDKATKPKAVEMLRHVISSPNDPDYVVEHFGAQDDARELLKVWGVK